MPGLRLALVLIPALFACTPDEDDTDFVVPDPNTELPGDLAELFDGAVFSSAVAEADYTSVSCAEGQWTITTDVQGSASSVVGTWWDLSALSFGPSFTLDAAEGTGFGGLFSTDELGLECDEPVLFVVVPVDAEEGAPGIADVTPFLGGMDNAVRGSGFASANTTGTMEVQTEANVDKATVHVLNPFVPYYWGPSEMSVNSASAWTLEVELTDDLAATSFDSVWIGFAALEGGQLVGLGGV